MKIILVRHGESEHNAGITKVHDAPLTKKGQKQSESLGKRLKKEKIKIDYIYTSNLKRAKETSDIISKILKVPIKCKFDGLNEYPGEHLRDHWKLFFNRQVRKLKKILKEIEKDKERKKNVMIVAHGITNRIIIGYLLKIPLKKSLLRLSQENTGISILKWNKEYNNWSLRKMNDSNHLPERLR